MKYYKKPVIVRAMRWCGDTSATKIIDWVLSEGGTARYHESVQDVMPRHIAVDTLDATARVFYGDWMVRGVRGEFYPCKPDIFEATYEKVPS